MRRAIQLVACGVICALSAVHVGASAQRRRPVRVALGELGGDRAEAFDAALREALSRTPEVRLTEPRRAQLVLRGSVQHLERRIVDGQVEVRCEVSVIVADARGGAIRAMLQGRAGARGDGETAALSRDALRAAVRGALRPLGTTGHALARAR